MSETPSLSVVMPVRNAMPYLDEAIESVLQQCFTDFELIVGDDCSTDGSRERLHYWATRDPRIRVLESDRPLGPVGSSNWVATAARAPIVARMDADDLSAPGRFRRQFQALADHPDAVLAGSLYDAIDQHGRLTRPRDRSLMLQRNSPPPVAHGSIMYRDAAFKAVGGYSQNCDFFEDIDLYARISALGDVLVLPEACYAYRFSANSSRLSTHAERVEQVLDAFRRAPWDNAVGITRTLEAQEAGGRKVLPRVLMEIGSLRLWAGRSPGMLRRMLSRAQLGWNRETAIALIWALWGALSPESLRVVLRRRAAQRDSVAAASVPDGCVYRWGSQGGQAHTV